MKEYRMLESRIKKTRKLTLIFLVAILTIVMIPTILYMLQSQESTDDILFVVGGTLVFSVGIFYIGLKLAERRLKAIKLIMNENFLVWKSLNQGNWQIKYSDIKQITQMKKKGIVLKINGSFRSIYIPHFIEDIDNIYLLLKNEVDRCTDI